MKNYENLNVVPADSNLISLGRLCQSAIDHHRHSTNTGQCVIGTDGQNSFGRNTSEPLNLRNEPPLIAAGSGQVVSGGHCSIAK